MALPCADEALEEQVSTGGEAVLQHLLVAGEASAFPICCVGVEPVVTAPQVVLVILPLLHISPHTDTTSASSFTEGLSSMDSIEQRWFVFSKRNECLGTFDSIEGLCIYRLVWRFLPFHMIYF